MATLVVNLHRPPALQCRKLIPVTHAYANTSAQSLAGLPMDDRKIILDMGGNLCWSHWTMKRRGLDVPFGSSARMPGVPAIQVIEAGVLADNPADWISPGEGIRIRNAPVTLDGKISFRLIYTRPGEMALTLTPPPKPVEIRARFPIGEEQSIRSAKVNDNQVRTFSDSHVFLQQVAVPVRIEVEFR